jgi:hypothetical protein
VPPRHDLGWWLRRGVALVLGLVLLVMLWQAVLGRRGGRFPVLRDVVTYRLEEAAPADKVRPALRQVMAGTRPGEAIPFLVDLNDQLDTLHFGDILDKRELRNDKEARRAAFRDALRLLAEDRQADLLRALEKMRLAGRVERYDPFHIVNRVAVMATDPAVVDELAARRDVARLVEAAPVDELRRLPLERTLPPATPPPGEERNTIRVTGDRAEPVSWALAAIRAEAAWQRGLDGRGVVVGLLDTGARADHDQLRGNWRGATAPDRAEDSWYQPRDPNSKVPVDTAMHGTMVLSAAVGQNRPLRDGRECRIGVAPGASWVAAAAHVNDRFNRIFFTAAADWMLFHARPDVVIHTYTWPEEASDELMWWIFSAFKATETVVVFAAGNQGPEPSRQDPPADLLGLYWARVPAFTVGSVNRDLEASYFSARGPNRRDFSTLYPQVVAPGEELTLAFPLSPDAIISQWGTSFAVGYAAGAAAVLLQAAPDLRPNEVEFYLKNSARRLGPGERQNNTYGWGLIDLAASLEALEGQGRLEVGKAKP